LAIRPLFPILKPQPAIPIQGRLAHVNLRSHLKCSVSLCF
jgi:hypothetical protein